MTCACIGFQESNHGSAVSSTAFRKRVQETVQDSMYDGVEEGACDCVQHSMAHLVGGDATAPLLLLAADQADLQRSPCLVRKEQDKLTGWAARIMSQREPLKGTCCLQQ